MTIYCPYCLTQQAFNRPVCGNCNRGNLKNYIEYARKNPPVWLVTFGFPGHGKSSAINALSLYIEHLDKIADGVFYDYLDEQTWDSLDEMRLQNVAAIVHPDPTEQTEGLPAPLLIGIEGFPADEANTIVIYDLAGEAAVKPNEDYVRSIQNATTAWFIVSLDDMSGSESRNDTQPRNINGLFMRYRNIMRGLNASLRGRTILVNYTKADLYLQPNSQQVDKMPGNVEQYYMDDPYHDLASPKIHADDLPQFNDIDYQQKLDEISDDLRTFTRNYVPGGRAFIDQAERRYGMNVQFCITSATGGSQGDTEITRYRVLDPLIWAVELNRSEMDRSINAALIVSPSLYDTQYPTYIYNALSGYGANVTTYHVGEKGAVFESGQVPNQRMSQAQIPLIGPILDRFDANPIKGRNISITLLDDHTPVDLYDFRYTHWEKDLHVITSNQDSASGWSNRTVLDAVEVDFDFLVSDLLADEDR